MSVTLKAELDIAAALAPLASLGKDAMRNAWRRALKKSANWVKGQTAKHVSAEMHIAQKLVRQRLYFFLRSADKGKVWLGLNAVEAHRLGNPRQTRRGVSVGRHRFDKAWIYRSARGSKSDARCSAALARRACRSQPSNSTGQTRAKPRSAKPRLRSKRASWSFWSRK